MADKFQNVNIKFQWQNCKKFNIAISNYLATQVADRVKAIGFVVSKPELQAQRGKIFDNIVKIVNTLFDSQYQKKCYSFVTNY